MGKKKKVDSPSLMLATPGCWAWEEMGALVAGVFCGVLRGGVVSIPERNDKHDG